MTAGIKTLEIMDRPGQYEYLDKITGKLINGLLDAAREAGHKVCGGHINGALHVIGIPPLMSHTPAKLVYTHPVVCRACGAPASGLEKSDPGFICQSKCDIHASLLCLWQ